LQWGYPVWNPAPELDPTALKRATSRRKRIEEKEPAAPKPEWTVETFVARFIGEDARTESRITVDAEAEKISERKAGRFIKVAEEKGLIHRWSEANPSKPVKYSTIPQPVTATVEGGGN
jgi:hypothetical protein